MQKWVSLNNSHLHVLLWSLCSSVCLSICLSANFSRHQISGVLIHININQMHIELTIKRYKTFPLHRSRDWCIDFFNDCVAIVHISSVFNELFWPFDDNSLTVRFHVDLAMIDQTWFTLLMSWFFPNSSLFYYLIDLDDMELHLLKSIWCYLFIV